jgi:hypothetical protein
MCKCKYHKSCNILKYDIKYAPFLALMLFFRQPWAVYFIIIFETFYYMETPTTLYLTKEQVTKVCAKKGRTYLWKLQEIINPWWQKNLDHWWQNWYCTSFQPMLKKSNIQNKPWLPCYKDVLNPLKKIIPLLPYISIPKWLFPQTKALERPFCLL